MHVRWSLVLLFLAPCALAQDASDGGSEVSPADGCSKDIDCKGDRICTARVCVEPPEPEVEPAVEDDSPALTVHVFGDVSAGVQDVPGEFGFALGQLDFFVQGRAAHGLTVLSEVVAEFGDGTPGIDVERLQLTYSFRDWAGVTVGRTHAPFGAYNTRFHHGAWLETQIGRPRVLAFEDRGGVLPVHQIGLELFGKLAGDHATFGYTLALGNGRGVVNDDVQAVRDLDFFKSVHGVAFVKLPAIGLRVGADVYVDRAPASSDLAKFPLRSQPIGELIIGAHANWEFKHFELMAEYYHLRHTTLGQSLTSSTHAWFAIAAYQLGIFRPYVGLEGLLFDRAVIDPFFSPTGAPLADELIARAGLKIWLSELTALKAEYRRDFTQSSHSFTIQVAFGL